MLRIRREQWIALTEVPRRRFVDRVVSYMRGNWSMETANLNDAALRKLIIDGRELAEKHGIDIEADVVVIIELCMLFGMDFLTSDEFPYGMSTIKASNVDARARVQMLHMQAKRAWAARGKGELAGGAI